MLLTHLKVKNYLSVNGQSELPVDPRVTVLLGANDHGKSNLLRSLEHLNFETPLLADDENWDTKGPRLDFTFLLTEGERRQLQEVKEGYLRELEAASAVLNVSKNEVESEEEDEEASAIVPTVTSSTTSAATSLNERVVAVAGIAASPKSAATLEDDDDDDDEDDEYDNASRDVTLIETDLDFVGQVLDSDQIVLYRDGIGSPLMLNGRSVEDLDGDFDVSFTPMIPRVELFKAFSGELQDSITAKEISNKDAEFLQGIFYYAGLNPLDCAALFIHDDETDKALEEASDRLDSALRARWAQGVDLDLHFQLKHRGSSIELLVEDPAVKKRKARMSKRSAGVTQFFRLSMVLHARRMKNPANSYLYIFDEPGVFLHPKGQKDLLAVFEQLAADTQIVYATHSLFMLNQNFPERHRLITKSVSSTVVDAKPYRANWKFAVDALGVRLTANILFSPNILLVEGDSDPIYIYELIRVLNHLGQTDGDANLLGIMSYSDLPNLRFLMQTFKSESKERLLTVLFDGDQQGRQYQKDVGKLLKTHEVGSIELKEGLAIEDYCLDERLFTNAVDKTLRASFEAIERKAPADLEEQISKSFEGFKQRTKQQRSKERKASDSDAAAGKEEQAETAEMSAENAGAWFKAIALRLTDNGSSKVALARNYAFLSREKSDPGKLDAKKVELGKELVGAIVRQLQLPSQRAKRGLETQ